MATPATGPPQGWVLYDGECGICSRWVPRWAPTLRRIGLGIAPLQTDWVSARTGLAPEALLNEFRVLHADGRLTTGADAYRFIMRRCWWMRPLHVVSIIPIGRQVFDWCYRTFARHRRQISSACRIEPPSSV